MGRLIFHSSRVIASQPDSEVIPTGDLRLSESYVARTRASSRGVQSVVTVTSAGFPPSLSPPPQRPSPLLLTADDGTAYPFIALALTVRRYRASQASVMKRAFQTYAR